jgi:DedD protein
MEKQIRHRLLGVLVVIALVIILLPFFQTSNKTLVPASTILAAAPPFPDQPADITAAASEPAAPLTLAEIPQPDAATINIKDDKHMAAIFKKPAPLDEGLSKLKNSVWVVQVGSFKNKTNALNVVNQLRANGYRAFIQEVTDSTTRVYVGPEHKQISARALADRLQTEMHLKGVVISYTPLTM